MGRDRLLTSTHQSSSTVDNIITINKYLVTNVFSLNDHNTPNNCLAMLPN